MTDPTERKTPPETPEEWAYIWSGAEKANEGWVVVGPFAAIVRNWKAWAAGLVFFIALNRPEILDALRAIFGVGK